MLDGKSLDNTMKLTFPRLQLKLCWLALLMAHNLCNICYIIYELFLETGNIALESSFYDRNTLWLLRINNHIFALLLISRTTCRGYS